jgi:hypothetical protein
MRSFGYKRVIDMSGHERRDQKYFEGTGEGAACAEVCETHCHLQASDGAGMGALRAQARGRGVGLREWLDAEGLFQVRRYAVFNLLGRCGIGAGLHCSPYHSAATSYISAGARSNSKEIHR